MTDTRQALPPNGEPLNPEEWSAGYEQGFADARAALAAQPVAGAVATDETGWLIEHSGEILPGAEQRAQVSWLRVQMKFNGYGAREFGFTHDANEALRFARKEDAEAVLAMHLGASPPDWYSKPFSVTEHMWPLVPQPQAAPAPEPSAQAVAHPSHQTVREWMPVSEALRLSDLWTAGDLDNCGQWRAAIKVLADEVRALAASPQPEPSAQGEPVALTEPACHGNGGCCPDDKCEKWKPRASAPSTPPHAVVEAVPLNFDQLQKVMSKHFGGRELTDDEADSAEAFARAIERAHGIAPKAAQEKT